MSRIHQLIASGCLIVAKIIKLTRLSRVPLAAQRQRISLLVAQRSLHLRAAKDNVKVSIYSSLLCVNALLHTHARAHTAKLINSSLSQHQVIAFCDLQSFN